MWSDPKPADRLGLLADRLRQAQAVTPKLISNVIADACVHLAGLGRTEKVARMKRLIGAGAWTEAALALIELEIPQWRLRRLVCEDGEWHCALSKQPNLPVGFDDTADARHEMLPLALLSAFLEAKRHAADVREFGLPTVPEVSSTTGYAVCCDNFS